MIHESDYDLVGGLRRRDDQAIRKFVQTTGSTMFRAVLRILRGDHAAAEEIMQEAIVRVLDNIETFRGDSRLASWAVQIAVRGALAVVRQNAHRHDLFEAEGTPTLVANVDSNPEAPLVVRSWIDAAPLRDREREIAKLWLLNDMTDSEIAAHLGLMRTTVVSARSRARTTLEGYLRAELVAA